MLVISVCVFSLEISSFRFLFGIYLDRTSLFQCEGVCIHFLYCHALVSTAMH